MYNGLVNYDASFFTNLSRILNEETVATQRDRNDGNAPAARHRRQGVQAGRPTVPLLKAAAEEALAWLMYKAATDVTPWWPDSQ